VHKILVINPGSTTTKIGVFEDKKPVFLDTIRHSTEELKPFKDINDQISFRKDVLMKTLNANGIDVKTFSAVVARGGLLKPVCGGTFKINKIMVKDLEVGVQGKHASNIAGQIAYPIAEELGIPSYIVDPVVVDEMEPIARISGRPELPRTAILHALNIRATAKRFASAMGKSLKDMNLVVVHLGGGVSMTAMKNGRMIDIVNGLGEGPLTPERAGDVPTRELVDLCFSGRFSKDEIMKMLIGKGGLVAYLGTNDAMEVEKRISNGDGQAELIYRAMAYQISKYVGAMATVLSGKVDNILITGGLAHSKLLTDWIVERVKFIAPVVTMPGEDEMEALALGALAIMRGEEEVLEYK
jgi:butyrate kinase